MDYTEIVSKAQSGDSQAITTLYNETYKQAYSVALQITKNEEEAFDILQDSYVKAFNNLHTLADKSKFKSWLFQIVSNKCKDYLKSKRHDLVYFSEMTYETDSGEQEVEFEDESTSFSPQEQVDYNETKRLIAEMMNNLPEDQKLVLLMYYVQELSIKEIAESLEVSENTVKSRMNYGKKKLKLQVEELEKKGTKLYGITGFALFGFIAWMLKGSAETVSAPPISNVLSIKPPVLSNANPSQMPQQYSQPPQQYPQQNIQYNQPPMQYPPQNMQYGQVPQQFVAKQGAKTVASVGKKVSKHIFLKVVGGILATTVAGTAVAATVSPEFRRNIDVFGWIAGPETAIEVYENAVNENDVEKLISCAHPNVQKQLSPYVDLPFFGKFFVNIINSYLEFTSVGDVDIQVKNIEYNESKDHAVVDVEIVSSNGTKKDTYDMDRISDKWYLSESEFNDALSEFAEELQSMLE